MKFTAEINVMPLRALLDPQGKAVNQTLNNINFKNIENVRIGKHISLEIDADNKNKAEEIIDEICKKVLSNPVMEYYEFKISK